MFFGVDHADELNRVGEIGANGFFSVFVKSPEFFPVFAVKVFQIELGGFEVFGRHEDVCAFVIDFSNDFTVEEHVAFFAGFEFDGLLALGSEARHAFIMAVDAGVPVRVLVK
jgi:hypothetical protein